MQHNYYFSIIIIKVLSKRESETICVLLNNEFIDNFLQSMYDVK